MKERKKTIQLEPRPERISSADGDGATTVGIVANYDDSGETRFLLTPEACGLIGASGLRVVIESGAGAGISFPDESYAGFGVEITTRDRAMKCDIVVSFAPLRELDILRMRKGGILLCMMDATLYEREIVDALLDHQVTVCCLDNMESFNGIPVFADIIDELDGRASIIYAQHSLSLLGGGKGVILAGVAGLNPCEVLVLGDGNVEIAAAMAALDAGAYVTLMNNDISALQSARQICGPQLNTVAMHPRVLFNKVKTADVILAGTCTRPFEFPLKLRLAMKPNVFFLDFNETHPSVTAPRTVAMALSNPLVNFFDEMLLKDGFDAMLSTSPGMQRGIITYRGNLVDKPVASALGMPCVDLSIILAGRN